MTEFDQGTVNVSLISADDGADRIALHMVNGADASMALTPSQARALATELISAVNRAEVKANLKVSSNMRRRQGESPSYPGEQPHTRLATAR